MPSRGDDGREASARRACGYVGEAQPSVFSTTRDIQQPDIELADGLEWNVPLRMEGRTLLRRLPASAIPAAFFDPQYRGVLDHLSYGNEGKSRGRARSALRQMPEKEIGEFLQEIDRVLMPSGHRFLWMDMCHLCTGFQGWLAGTSLETVDMFTWNKLRMGMGYRTRRTAEYLVVLQRTPRRAKGVWKVHTIPDVWEEGVTQTKGAHPKPVGLQTALIEAVTNPQDVVVDPAAGTFSVLSACRNAGRNFIGCDISSA